MFYAMSLFHYVRNLKGYFNAVLSNTFVIMNGSMLLQELPWIIPQPVTDNGAVLYQGSYNRSV